jgi:hypothetical protein
MNVYYNYEILSFLIILYSIVNKDNNNINKINIIINYIYIYI